MNNDPCRFCRLYALSLLPIAALLGALLTWQTAFALQHSELFMPPRQLEASEMQVRLLHAVAPAANGSALMIALVLWVHPLAVSVVALELPRVLKRAALVAIPGFLAALLASWAVSYPLGVGALDIPAQAFAVSGLRAWNVGFGVVATVADAALVLFAAWRFLPRVQAMRLSLPAKLVLSWTVLFPLRAFVGLVLQANLPG
jgi:hypothetical protein